MLSNATQTDQQIQYADKTVDAIKNPCKSTQTTEVNKYDERFLAKISFNKEIIDCIIEALQECEAEDNYFRALDDMRKDEKVDLFSFRSVDLPSTEHRSVVALVGDCNMRVAVLFGEPHHETWCQHSNSGRVLIYNKLSFSSAIYLSNCATKAVFAPQNQLIVATALGELLLCFDGEIIWRSNSMHSQCVTCMHWMSRSLLLTSGLDGRVVLSSIKTNRLEIVKSVTVEMTDLSRTLQKSNAEALERCVGIVAITGNDSELYIASETGAIWELDPNDLSLRQYGLEISGIENFVLTILGEFRKKPKNSFSESVPLLTIRNSLKAFCFNSRLNLLLSVSNHTNNYAKNNNINNNKEGINDNYESLIGFDLATKRIVMQKLVSETPHFEAITLCDNETVLVGISDNFRLHFYNFAIDL